MVNAEMKFTFIIVDENNREIGRSTMRVIAKNGVVTWFGDTTVRVKAQ